MKDWREMEGYEELVRYTEELEGLLEQFVGLVLDGVPTKDNDEVSVDGTTAYELMDKTDRVLYGEDVE